MTDKPVQIRWNSSYHFLFTRKHYLQHFIVFSCTMIAMEWMNMKDCIKPNKCTKIYGTVYDDWWITIVNLSFWYLSKKRERQRYRLPKRLQEITIDTLIKHFQFSLKTRDHQIDIVKLKQQQLIMESGTRKLQTNPRERANWLSILFFAWTIPIFKRTHGKLLDASDVNEPLKEDQSYVLGNRLERYVHDMRKCRIETVQPN